MIIDSQSTNLIAAQWYRNDVPTDGLPRHQNFQDIGTNLTVGLKVINITKTDSGAMYHCTPSGQPRISSRRASIVVAGTFTTSCSYTNPYISYCSYNMHTQYVIARSSHEVWKIHLMEI